MTVFTFNQSLSAMQSVSRF